MAKGRYSRVCQFGNYFKGRQGRLSAYGAFVKVLRGVIYMGVKSFEDLFIWQKAMDLVDEVYKQVKKTAEV